MPHNNVNTNGDPFHLIELIIMVSNNNANTNGDPFHLIELIENNVVAVNRQGDQRDRRTASSSTQASLHVFNYQDENLPTHVDIPLSANVDPTTATLIGNQLDKPRATPTELAHWEGTPVAHSSVETQLEAIVKGAGEPLHEHIDDFNREAIQVPTTNDMKRYILEKGLHGGSEFWKVIGIEPPKTLYEFLYKEQAYILYEGKKDANKARVPSWPVNFETRRPCSFPECWGEKKGRQTSWNTRILWSLHRIHTG